MAQSLAKIYIHLIFSTKERRDLLPKELQKDVHAFMGAHLNAMGCPVCTVGGTANHVHVLFQMNVALSVKDVVRDLKANTSKWLHRNPQMGEFAWQSGYAALSVSQSGVDAVFQYIANQEEHHRKRSFQDELKGFLDKFHIEYDERYLWT